jgi:hypothetical protein
VRRVLAVALFALVGGAQARADWKADQLADALKAAPPVVTRTAKIYGWEGTKRVLLRDGEGPYTCVASGAWSLRVGKPALPYPDCFCADQNAWAFIQANWALDPKKPQPLPTAPGLVWMLAGMNISAAGGHDHNVSAKDAITMTPHIMILPLPIDAEAAGLRTAYDPKDPLTQWVMMSKTPAEHLHVHFSEPVKKALMAGAKP